MMKTLVVLFPLFLVGCLKTRTELSELEKQKAIKQKAVAMQKAAKQAEIDEAFDLMRELTGKVEVLEKDVQDLKRKNQEKEEAEAHFNHKSKSRHIN